MDPSWAKFYPKGEDSGPDGLEEAKKLWLREVQTRPSDSRVLYNTGEFFSSIHKYVPPEEFLKQAFHVWNNTALATTLP
jgi:hypothetical protein